MNKTQRLYVSVKTATPSFVQKILKLQLPYVKTVLKQKNLKVPGNCRANTFVLCGTAMGNVFSSSDKIGRQRKVLLQKSIVLGNLWELTFWQQRGGEENFLLTSTTEAACSTDWSVTRTLKSTVTRAAIIFSNPE
jgi:hypothetical protein